MFERKQIWSVDEQMCCLFSGRPLSHRGLSSSVVYPLTNKRGPGFKLGLGLNKQLSVYPLSIITEVGGSNSTEAVVHFFLKCFFLKFVATQSPGPTQRPLKNRLTSQPQHINVKKEEFPIPATPPTTLGWPDLQWVYAQSARIYFHKKGKGARIAYV